MVAPPALLGQLQYFDSGKHSSRLKRKAYLDRTDEIRKGCYVPLDHLTTRKTPGLPIGDFAGYRVFPGGGSASSGHPFAHVTEYE